MVKSNPKPRKVVGAKKEPLARHQGKNHPQLNVDHEIGKAAPTIPLELQQLLLNIFRNSFPPERVTHIQPIIQEVKQHLYQRDFGAAFGREDYLQAYALRWSPSRALAYLEILSVFSVLSERLSSLAHCYVEHAKQPSPPAGQERVKSTPASLDRMHGEARLRQNRRVILLGGGAGAEVVALAGFLNLHNRVQVSENKLTVVENPSDSQGQTPGLSSGLQLCAIDIASWSPVLEKLNESITSPPPLSKFASEAVREASAALLDSAQFSVSFRQQDILSLQTEGEAIDGIASLLGEASLVTMMFTLNELYTISMAKTTRFLLNLTALTHTGLLLLVVDSPGSYSTVSIPTRSGDTNSRSPTENKYPMKWLLDHTLLEASSTRSNETDGEGAQWEKLISEDSKWFRRPPSLKYPVELEDMRYQIHIYRRL
ncbi:MAG: hypothetical protein M1834_002213 [Cirrosporium novae-zelandiae]|nr:MAG: hypothetical protein M1834_002213 [Cirrosporium novae-zelandiae]